MAQKNAKEGQEEILLTGITHFTSQAAAASILDGWLRELSSDRKDRLKGPPDVTLRLYSRSGMNDPTEQTIAEYVSDVTMSKSGERRRDTVPDDSFLMCGTEPQSGKKGEAANRLDMWRAYGDDGKGVAITTWWDAAHLQRIDGLEIIQVEYTKDTDNIKREAESLLQSQADHGKSQSDREMIRKRRMRLEAKHKHTDYESEREVRLACFLGDESGAILAARGKGVRLDATSGRLRTFIERPIQVGTSLKKMDITLGPRLTENETRHWQKMAQWVLARMSLSGGTVQRSELKYIG